VIFLGNSITQGGDWAKLTGDSTVINRGIGADITFGLRARLADVTKRKPSKLFVLIGINDISKDIPDAVIAAQYRALIDSVKSQSPQTRIYVQSILPLNPTVKNFPQHYDKQARVVAVNRLLREMARATGTTYIDLWPIFVDRQNRLDASLTGDGLHLNQQGYERWVRFLVRRGYLAPGTAQRAASDTVAVWMTTGDRSALLAKQPTLTFGRRRTTARRSPSTARRRTRRWMASASRSPAEARFSSTGCRRRRATRSCASCSPGTSRRSASAICGSASVRPISAPCPSPTTRCRPARPIPPSRRSRSTPSAPISFPC
jgi:lysophospholipase L1-like esterase